MTQVAINGFGRIGRLAFRQMFEAEGYEVVAINDLTSPAMLAHLLKYDTAQRGYCGVIGENLHTVESTEDSIIVDGKEIKIYAEKDAANCPWGKLDVDVVLECTGFYCSKDKSMILSKISFSSPAMVFFPDLPKFGLNPPAAFAMSALIPILAPIGYAFPLNGTVFLL